MIFGSQKEIVVMCRSHHRDAWVWCRSAVLLAALAVGQAWAERPPGAWWATNVGGSGIDTATGVAMDGSSSVYVTGMFASNIDLGITQLSATSQVSNALLLKYSVTGDARWAGGART